MKAIVPAWRANSVSQNWFNEFDHLFENLFETSQRRPFPLACDIEESENFILVSFDLPGVEESDIGLELKDSVLTVSGERKRILNDESSRHFSGRHHGSFTQSFRLPKKINQEAIEADYENGVLKILLPKNEEARPQKIELKSKKGGLLKDLLGGKKEA